uniref:GRIP and coiled-coil domain-containing protein PFC0235w-like isoform X2 n=1 Tax=Phascolarctos cinereus TaxID=38626 RepID=A0A6P5LJH5_PHACI|nr:GRIP and coiled-coil domain-containing protein PFC0235w-like isoform X2 [Phascolarctos cinereus]
MERNRPGLLQDSYQMHAASARQEKHENTNIPSENSTTENKYENTPVQVYENHWTRSPQNRLSTLQNPLVLNAQNPTDDEVVRMNKKLEEKRQEWKKRMEIVAKGKTELLKGQKYRNQLMNKLLKESKVKKQQALEKWAADVKTNKIKQEEIEYLTQELRDLRDRKQKMKKKMEKYRPFEDFLVKVLDKLPNCFRSWDLNSSIKKIMDHYEMLSNTNKRLIKQVSSLSDARKKAQKNLEALQLKHANSTLVLNTELSTLQKKLDEVKEKNREMKMNVQIKKSISKDGDQHLGTAITNLAEQCQIQHYGPLKQLDLCCKLEMIQHLLTFNKWPGLPGSQDHGVVFLLIPQDSLGFYAYEREGDEEKRQDAAIVSLAMNRGTHHHKHGHYMMKCFGGSLR